MLVPYVRRNLSAFDPFRELDEIERAFFGNNDSKMTPFSTDIKTPAASSFLRPTFPASRRKTSSSTFRTIF